jgi:hypothetical protein
VSWINSLVAYLSPAIVSDAARVASDIAAGRVEQAARRAQEAARRQAIRIAIAKGLRW